MIDYVGTTSGQRSWASTDSDVKPGIYLAISDETFVVWAKHASPARIVCGRVRVSSVERIDVVVTSTAVAAVGTVAASAWRNVDVRDKKRDIQNERR
jgi:hypothetical protein